MERKKNMSSALAVLQAVLLLQQQQQAAANSRPGNEKWASLFGSPNLSVRGSDEPFHDYLQELLTSISADFSYSARKSGKEAHSEPLELILEPSPFRNEKIDS